MELVSSNDKLFHFLGLTLFFLYWTYKSSLRIQNSNQGITTNPLAIPFRVVSRLVWLANFSEFTLTSRLNNPVEGNDNVWFESPFMAVILLVFTISCPSLVQNIQIVSYIGVQSITI